MENGKNHFGILLSKQMPIAETIRCLTKFLFSHSSEEIKNNIFGFDSVMFLKRWAQPTLQSLKSLQEILKMSKLKEIEESIFKLPQDDLAVLREWFEEFDAKKWDEQFENDAKSGKLDPLAREAVEDYRAKKCKEL